MIAPLSCPVFSFSYIYIFFFFWSRRSGLCSQQAPVHRVPPYIWLSALMSPEGSGSALFLPQPSTSKPGAHSDSSASASPSIMQPIVSSCSPHVSLFTPTFTLLHSLLVSGLVVHSLIQTFNQPCGWQSGNPSSLTVTGHMKSSPTDSVTEVID